jgi:HAE1 family hydrophobic/amphiphilic exporter-1
MSLYEGAVKRPIMTSLVFLTVVILGLFSLAKLPIDLYPDIDTNQIMVLTYYTGASAEDIENNVTRPLENTLNSVEHLKHITSNSKENVSVVTLEFEYGYDIDVLTNNVRDKLDMVANSLPTDAQDPIIFKFSTDMIPILLLSVQADESQKALYKILDDNVANPLARIDGVGTVSISGAPERQINVYMDARKMEAYGISAAQVSSAIAAENKNVTEGTVDIGNDTYTVRMEGEFDDPTQMNDVIVGTYNGANVYLKDVARIEDNLEERAQKTYNNGKQGAMIVVQKQSGGNSVAISNAVMEKLPELQKTLPSDVKLGIIVNTSDNIMNTIDSLQETIQYAMLFVLIVVFVFLGRWRAMIIICVTIPMSLIASFIYLLATDGSLNMISLSCLSIAIGNVVDDAIVVLENVTTHIERGSDPKQAAIHGTNEVAISVIASTLTMIAVFFPLTMVTGMTGVLFKQLGWMMCVIMTISTTSALSFTPMLCSQMLKLKKKAKKLKTILKDANWFVIIPMAVVGIGGLAYAVATMNTTVGIVGLVVTLALIGYTWDIILGLLDKIDATYHHLPFIKWLDKLDAWYEHRINWAVRHRGTVITACFVLFIGSCVLAKVVGIKSGFFPTNDNGRIGATLELPIGTRVERAEEVAAHFAKMWMERYGEDMQACNYTVGQAGDNNTFASLQTNGSNIISFNIQMVPSNERELSLATICDEMREDCKKTPELDKYQVLLGGQSASMGGQSMATFEIYGYDFDKTNDIANELADKLRAEDMFSQVNISRSDFQPELVIDFDRDKLARLGLTMTSAASSVQNLITGSLMSYYREDGEEYDIRVRYEVQDRISVEDIENMYIPTATGNVRVKNVATVRESSISPTIERKDRQRVVYVKGVLKDGYALSDGVEKGRDIYEKIAMPSGINIQVAGSYEDQQDANRDLGMLGILILVLVYIVMAAQFESLSYPFIIALSILFAFSGIILILIATGTEMNVMSMLGGIMLLGIVVKNGIVLIDYTQLLRERGIGYIQSAVMAARSRLRPILMTTLTTILGMVPMAVGQGVGAEMWRPLGISIIGGLTVSTIMTLVYVPVMFCIFGGFFVKQDRKKIRVQRELDAYYAAHKASFTHDKLKHNKEEK